MSALVAIALGSLAWNGMAFEDAREATVEAGDRAVIDLEILSSDLPPPAGLAG